MRYRTEHSSPHPHLSARRGEHNKTNMTITINNTTYTAPNSGIDGEWLEQQGLCPSIETDVVDGGRYVEATIVSPHNGQKLLECIIDESDLAYEAAKKELTLTSQYHDWSNTVADQVYESIKECYDADGDLLDDCDGMTINDVVGSETVDQYNQYVVAYNQYSDLSHLNGETKLDGELPAIGL